MRGKLVPQPNIQDRLPGPAGSPLRLSGLFPDSNVGIIDTRATLEDRTATRQPTSIDQPRIVGAPAGVLFGQPNLKGFIGGLYRRASKVGPSDADTRPQRDSLRPQGDALPPNPGRPQFGDLEATERDA